MLSMRFATQYVFGSRGIGVGAGEVVDFQDCAIRRRERTSQRDGMYGMASSGRLGDRVTSSHCSFTYRWQCDNEWKSAPGFAGGGGFWVFGYDMGGRVKGLDLGLILWKGLRTRPDYENERLGLG